MTSPATLDYSGLEDPRCVNLLRRNLGCTASSERTTEKSGTSAKPMTWKEGFQSTDAVFETLNGSRPGRLLERASQKRRISAFEIWNQIRLPSTAQKETAGEAAPVRPHAHLKHVRGGSGGAGILDNACGGKVLRSPSAIGFFRGCEPVRELTQAPSRPDIRPIASTLSRVCSPGCTGSMPISITWPSVKIDQIDVHRPDTATLQWPWYWPRNGCSRKPG